MAPNGTVDDATKSFAEGTDHGCEQTEVPAADQLAPKGTVDDATKSSAEGTDQGREPTEEPAEDQSTYPTPKHIQDYMEKHKHHMGPDDWLLLAIITEAQTHYMAEKPEVRLAMKSFVARGVQHSVEVCNGFTGRNLMDTDRQTLMNACDKLILLKETLTEIEKMDEELAGEAEPEVEAELDEEAE